MPHNAIPSNRFEFGTIFLIVSSRTCLSLISILPAGSYNKLKITISSVIEPVFLSKTVVQVLVVFDIGTRLVICTGNVLDRQLIQVRNNIRTSHTPSHLQDGNLVGFSIL